MSLVATGQCSEQTARALTDQLRQATAGLAQQYQVWEGLVIEAYQREAWRALGYGSWHDYVTAEVPELQNLRFGHDERQQLVVSFRDVGMSTRAIGSALGIGQTQVRRDLGSPEPFGSREPADGDDEPVDAEIVDDPWSEPSPVHGERDDIPLPPLRVVGTDGKSYPAAGAIRPTRRRPITDTAMTLAFELQKVADKVDRFRYDDRLTANREKVSLRLRSQLQYAAEMCNELIEALEA